MTIHSHRDIRRNRSGRSRYRGILLADLMTGILIMALLATVLMVSLTLRSKSARKLEIQRAAMQQAERALVSLQDGQRPQAQDERLSIQRTGKLVGRMEWVEISVKQDGRTASLAGLAPTTRRAQP